MTGPVFENVKTRKRLILDEQTAAIVLGRHEYEVRGMLIDGIGKRRIEPDMRSTVDELRLTEGSTVTAVVKATAIHLIPRQSPES